MAEKIFGLSERLRICREERHATQQQIGNRVGIKREQIAKYEAGTTVPTLGHAVALADVYGVSMDFLLGRTNAPHLPVTGGEQMEDIDALRKAVDHLEATLRRVEAHGLALERVVRSQLPVTPDQWNRLLAQAHQQIERGESPS